MSDLIVLLSRHNNRLPIGNNCRVLTIQLYIRSTLSKQSNNWTITVTFSAERLQRNYIFCLLAHVNRMIPHLGTAKAWLCTNIVSNSTWLDTTRCLDKRSRFLNNHELLVIFALIDILYETLNFCKLMWWFIFGFLCNNCNLDYKFI